MYLHELEKIRVALNFYNKYICKVEKLREHVESTHSTIPKRKLRRIHVS